MSCVWSAHLRPLPHVFTMFLGCNLSPRQRCNAVPLDEFLPVAMEFLGCRFFRVPSAASVFKFSVEVLCLKSRFPIETPNPSRVEFWRPKRVELFDGQSGACPSGAHGIGVHGCTCSWQRRVDLPYWPRCPWRSFCRLIPGSCLHCLWTPGDCWLRSPCTMNSFFRHLSLPKALGPAGGSPRMFCTRSTFLVREAQAR